ncbi:Lrp/AsnC family transcriptional regulator [Candidatus Woesearchaeota archaeon]|nr:Lrp/AsnC family transcriptional regulator [Candidatus Woesearchaeota archaeon]
MLTKLDYKILSELDSNARQSYGQIATAVGSSKQVVSNHVQMLFREGYIQWFLTAIDFSKVGQIIYKVYLRLMKASEEDELKIVFFLKAHPLVVWLARAEGIYDIAFAVSVREVGELNKLLIDLENQFGRHIFERAVNTILRGEFLNRGYLTDEKITGMEKKADFQSTQVSSVENLPVYKPDEVDNKILVLLCRNPRESVVKIAETVPLTADAICKRIKRIEQTGIIKRYLTVLNHNKLDSLHYKVLIRVSDFNEETERKFFEFCRVNKNIVFFNKGIGSWEVEIDVEVRTSEEFRRVMRQIKQEFAGSIKEYFSLIIYEILKFEFMTRFTV